MAQAMVTLKLTPGEFAIYGLALDVLIKIAVKAQRSEAVTVEFGLPLDILECARIEAQASNLRKATR